MASGALPPARGRHQRPKERGASEWAGPPRAQATWQAAKAVFFYVSLPANAFAKMQGQRRQTADEGPVLAHDKLYFRAPFEGRAVRSATEIAPASCVPAYSTMAFSR